MVDPGKLIREWILSQASITSLLGTSPGSSVYFGDLPAYFDPKNGPGIQLFLSGGVGHDEITQIFTARCTLKTIAQFGENKVARQVFAACYDVMHGANMIDFGADGRVITSAASSVGQDVSDPTSGWAQVIGMFSIQMIQTS